MLSDRQTRVRVLIVDDHELTRVSLKIFLSQQRHIEVIGLASDGLEAIEKAKDLRPDVVILDLQMPVLNGLTAAMEIKQLDPHPYIIAYTSVDDPQTEVMCEISSVDAFCEKDSPTEKLLEIINQAVERSHPISYL